MRASPINGEANLRGKREKSCLWMHVTCADCLGIDQLGYTDRIRIEQQLSGSIRP